MELLAVLGPRTGCLLLLTLFSVIVCGQEDAPPVCVPYYLCRGVNGTITTDGSNLIIPRSVFGDPTVSPCPNPLEVRCIIPPEFRTTTTSTSPVDTGGGETTTTTSAVPPTPQSAIVPPPSRLPRCGVRGEPPLTSRIMNSNGVSTGASYFAEFPWMMAILVEEIREDDTATYLFKCGGSLIHPSVVITAAHCLAGIKPERLLIRGGEWDTQSDSEPLPHQDRGVATMTVHPEYNLRNLHNDIAVIIVDSPFDLADNVATVCLPTIADASSFDNSRCFATGWGKDALTVHGQYQPILKKLDMPIVPRAECQSRLRRSRLWPYFLLHSSFICAGGELGADTCSGDGGGPLVCPLPQDNSRWVQVGVIAGSIGCGEGFPGLYADVAKYVSWIVEHIPSSNSDDGYLTAIPVTNIPLF